MRKIHRSITAVARYSASGLALALALATSETPLLAADYSAANAGDALTAVQNPANPSPNDPIIITAPLFRDIIPERQLDDEAIGSYGVSTIDQLISEVQAELGDDELPPLILVNGKRVDDIGDIGALPVEALRALQVLPRGSAVRSGGSASQRVVSLTLRRDIRSATITAAEKLATDGHWDGQRGELILTRIKGSTRANIAFRAGNESRLFESDRGIIQPAPRLPYALGGNIIGYPGTSGEIDPLLSAAAGEIVTVTPFPGTATPTIGDLVAGANQPQLTDVGDYRTLRPKVRNYDMNATFSTPLTPWLTSTASARFRRNSSAYLRGLPNALFVLPATNANSPFSRDVGLAFYGHDALRGESRQTGGEGSVTLAAEFGRWSANLNTKHNETKDVSTGQRQATFSPIAIADGVNPFAIDLAAMIPIRNDEASSYAVNNLIDLTADGPAAKLPAGPLQTAFEGRLGWYHLRSHSTYSVINPDGDFRRSEQSVRATVEVPLTRRADGFLPQIGDLSATAEYSRVHFSDAGTLNHHALALIWEPVEFLRLRAGIDETSAPAPIQTLGNPVVITPDVRIYDALTGQTVDVTQITGGNPFALPQTTKVRTVSALFRLVPRLNLQLSVDYTDTDRRNFLSSLPDQSAAIMLAFPERFVRNANGTLISVDLRPVNFDSDRERRLRWGVSMNKKIGGGSRVPGSPGTHRAPSPSTYFQFTANHTMVFSDEIVIRPGLDPVDLLAGGALGIGGGRVRHQVDANASLTSGGLGARAGVNWTGDSSLVTRIGSTTDTLNFAPVFLLNLRVFADAGRVLPSTKWARGFRLSLDAINITNARQRVTDSAGHTPLQYQPGYRNPIGRTIEIELRKVF